jgi:hypothetical protein
VVKPTRRAVVIAASFAVGLSFVGPYARAGLLDGGDSGASIEGLPLPVGGDVLGDELLGGLLVGDLLEDVLGGDLLEDGLPLDVLGGDLLEDGLPLDVLGGDLLEDGLPLDVLGGGLLGGEDGLLAAEGVVELVPDLGIVPGLGSISEILEAFSDSGSIVPGLQVLDEFGILGALGSM